MISDPRRALANSGEDLAQAHFRRLGFDVLGRNHRTRFGEIDLIVFDGDTLAFVEVKTRRAGCGEPLEAVGPIKQRRVRRMARHWLATTPHPRASDLRFDAVGVTLGRSGEMVRLDHLEGAF